MDSDNTVGWVIALVAASLFAGLLGALIMQGSMRDQAIAAKVGHYSVDVNARTSFVWGVQ